MDDVVIVGGGVIGLSLAWELSRHQLAVSVLDRGELGRESSWAGAGMLPPGCLATAKTPQAKLRGASAELWDEWALRLCEESGLDSGYHRCGGLELSPPGQESTFAAEIADYQQSGIAVETLQRDDLRTRFPFVNPDFARGYFLPDFCQVRNPRLLKGLIAACHRRGVKLISDCEARGWRTTGNRVTAVRTPTEEIAGRQFVVCGGAWSSGILESVGVKLEIRPLRGQIALLQLIARPFHPVVEMGRLYAVPRIDGRVLIGATEEDAGFVKQNTAEGIEQLLAFAGRLVPAFKSATVETFWAGLRPQAIRGLPYLGRAPNLENLFVAAGHFRDGLQLSPLTAVLLRQLLLEQTPLLPLESFGCHSSC